MWFTDSDKVLWTLVVCTFINVFGFTFMNDFLLAIFSLVTAYASARFTLYFKNSSDNSKKKERLERIEKAFKEVISTSILNHLMAACKHSVRNADSLEKGDEEYSFPDINCLNTDLIELFGNNDIVEIFVNKGIGVDVLFNINSSLKSIYNNSDSFIIRKYEEKKERIIDRHNKSIIDLQEYLKADISRFEDLNAKHNKRLENNKNVTIKNIKSYHDLCFETINNINVLLKEF